MEEFAIDLRSSAVAVIERTLVCRSVNESALTLN